MSNLEIGVHLKIFCNTCKGETHHELKGIHPRKYYEVENKNTPHEQLIFWEGFQYRFWVCLGCDTGSLEVAYTNAGMYGPQDKEVWEFTLHPKRKTSDLAPKRFGQLNPTLTDIYREIIESYNNNSKILCAIGLRALLEGICAEKDISGNKLYDKIDGLKAFLPENIVECLHGFRFMGNYAAHELQAPKQRELKLAIEVMEDLLNFLYELEYKARRLPHKR